MLLLLQSVPRSKQEWVMFDERGSSPEVLKMPREEHSVPPVRDLKEPPSIVVHRNSLKGEPGYLLNFAGSRCYSRSLESVLLRDGIGEPECSIR
jgi:hypothetical protein